MNFECCRYSNSRELSLGDTASATASWQTQHSLNHSNLVSNVLPAPAKPAGSLLSLWTAKQKAKANSSHVEFAGRSYGEMKAELYPQMRYITDLINKSMYPVPLTLVFLLSAS